MKNFAICYNRNIENSLEVKNKLYNILKSKKNDTEVLDIDCLKAGFDFVFVIGGDGTILKAARFYAKYETPVFGINLGRLGFLSQASVDELEITVDKILKNEFNIENRVMLKSGEYTALNDFVIKGFDSGRTSKFTLKINNNLVCNYLADGIIVSTPTGSTAYGLSAGGPVVNPALNVFVIVPICPHTLNARPIIIPDFEKITISADKRINSKISADGQEFFEFNSEILIEKSKNYAKLALLDNSDFYTILRNKLHWGISPEDKLF